jgi:hypothetical protein
LEALTIRDSLAELVDTELKVIHNNEKEYHRLQSEQYRVQQLIEEQDRQRREQEEIQFENPSCQEEVAVTPNNLLKDNQIFFSGVTSSNSELGINKDWLPYSVL